MACRIWATQQHPPPGQGIAQRVARRASFLIYTWNASGLRTEVAAVLLLLSVGALSRFSTAACLSSARQLKWVPRSKLALLPGLGLSKQSAGSYHRNTPCGHLLQAFLYKEWWEGILAVLLCLHALRVWRGQELEQPPSVQRYHLLMAAHGVIGKAAQLVAVHWSSALAGLHKQCCFCTSSPAWATCLKLLWRL